MPRVLVVDDDSEVMDITCRYIESLDGFVVVGRAGDGVEAGDLVRRAEPDLMVLDIYMPKKSGLELLAELRGEGNSVDVIFLTADADAAVMERAKLLGIADYLVKPFSFERFRESLLRCAGRIGIRG